MDASSTINELALTVIAGAYVLLFAVQLILWNRIEKMMQLIQHLEVEVMGTLPDIKRRITALEENQQEIQTIVHGLRFNHQSKLRDS